MAKVMLIGMKLKNSARLGKIFASVKVPCDVISTFDTAFEKIPADPPALIVAEKPDNIETLYTLNSILKTNAPATAFLVTLLDLKTTSAMEAMRAGAYDCLAQPYNRFDVLAAAKRASLRKGRTLFVDKVVRKKRPTMKVVLILMTATLLFFYVSRRRNGPPFASLSLGSANLSGIQWEDRDLLVGDWFESTVTHYHLTPGFFRKSRVLETKGLYKTQDGQPILVCNTPDALITLGSDLKLRSHQWAVGLPTLQTVSAPGVSPTGLAWDGKNVWSSDNQTNLLYRHGFDLKVLDAIKSFLPQPIGLAFDQDSLWVLGAGTPFKLARARISEKGVVWEGPYVVTNLLSDGILPSGMAIGHGRLWLISGGDPRMVSKSLDEITRTSVSWK